ncbi:hypothetical protein Leryth_016386 [Lithospermum erythrorhizon]|uniref:Uncharacterized protein n=1 Tax=Lithospermum erythrorhizon TaxID=34254 RepID=A0AAV3PQP1_LITER|nr:hypothetical protein Leryth_016386 [Lithospermum erythrorhizon]
MAFSRMFLVYIIAISWLFLAIEGTQMGFLMPPSLGSGCRGSVEECLAIEDEEFELDSESNRRILATKRYISYGALQKNNVPCSRRGASYYNCRPGAQANPYSRGCSAITRCRR